MGLPESSRKQRSLTWLAGSLFPFAFPPTGHIEHGIAIGAAAAICQVTRMEKPREIPRTPGCFLKTPLWLKRKTVLKPLSLGVSFRCNWAQAFRRRAPLLVTHHTHQVLCHGEDRASHKALGPQQGDHEPLASTAAEEEEGLLTSGGATWVSIRKSEQEPTTNLFSKNSEGKGTLKEGVKIAISNYLYLAPVWVLGERK